MFDRYWQDLGYLIIYVTARPDMQQKKVVTWLAQHNFPHGLVSFIDGLSADPLRQKANYLKQLKNEVLTGWDMWSCMLLSYVKYFCTSTGGELFQTAQIRGISGIVTYFK